ncbi:Protein OBERON 1 [Quillaja saponaria]|uniref:Protein OBERON 1 n=1 Tax=Quillaja saponaria TaxID=32244 RepID=A0AAD7VL72_QUISA|nr:Protein OBERON 1 [Quillaja saponaria]
MASSEENAPSVQIQLEKEILEDVTSDNPNGSKHMTKENTFALNPVSPGDSGRGLPYAPVDWPNPGDVWSWKVGKRTGNSGYYSDRLLYLPHRLQTASRKKHSFNSKPEVERYIRSNFPTEDLESFFSLFSWKIPSTKHRWETVEFASFPPKFPSREEKEDIENGEREEVTQITPRKRKQKAQRGLLKRQTRRSFKVSPPSYEDTDDVIDLCSNVEAMPSETNKGSSDFEADQVCSHHSSSPDSSSLAPSKLAAAKEPLLKYPFGKVADDFDDYLNSLDGILVPPSSESSLSDPAILNAAALEDEINESRKKLSSLLLFDFTSLISSNVLAELGILASKVRKDPNLDVDQLIKLKLVEEIPLISDAFLEAKGTIEQSDKFVADLEANKVKIKSLKEEYHELKDKTAPLQAEIDYKSSAMQEIDDQIAQLQLKRAEISSVIETKQKIKDELSASQMMIANTIQTVAGEIQLGYSEKPKWEMKKMNSAIREAEILARFAPLKGFSF